MDNKKVSGITLVALVVTIVVLLILAGITINLILGPNSIFHQTEKAKLQTQIAKAREKIEIVLNDAQIEKQTNPLYKQNEFLDEFILHRIKEAEILEGIIIVDNYVFELDRSIPKIGEYLGEKNELVFPEIEISAPVLAKDFKSATITITAREKTNRIYKMEILQNSDILKEYIYEDKKEEIEETYNIKQNGSYVVKVYSNLSTKKTVDVNGIVMSVVYEPNKNEEYKKEHQVKVSVNEKEDTVKSIKYQWLGTTKEPAADTFTKECHNNETITGESLTGTYYLWTMLETQSGKTNISRSDKFNFDNEGPTVKLTATPMTDKSFKITADATDTYSGILKYEFYVDNKLEDTQHVSQANANYTWNGSEMVENKNCYVIVYDGLGNPKKAEIKARTKIYSWTKQNITKPAVWDKKMSAGYSSGGGGGHWFRIEHNTEAYVSSEMPTLNTSTGMFNKTGTKITFPMEQYYKGKFILVKSSLDEKTVEFGVVLRIYNEDNYATYRNDISPTVQYVLTDYGWISYIKEPAVWRWR